MYVMKVDGKVFYAPTLHQSEYQVLTPRLKQEFNTSGELSFLLPPGHVMRDSIHKLKSVITVEQNGVEVFRGRVSEETVDTFNQKECYCEGDLSYLRDSMVKPYKFKGTAKDYFKQIIADHNEQVEEEKRFTVGLLTALSDDDKVETESDDYKDTLSEIKFILVNDFEGYLRTRYEDGVRYIDYIDKYDDVCTQKIEFGVNLIELDNEIDATEICTVLIPLGKRNKNKALTIEKVNDGSDRIENADAIARYGRIVKTYAWDEEEDPDELLRLGKEKLAEMAAVETLTLNAIDLHLLNVDVDKIRLGSKVQLVSKPHGLNKEALCTVVDIDLENPEKSTYTFGEPNKTLSSGVSANSRSIRDGESENRLRHNHTLQYFDEVNNRLNTVEFDMDAVEATILLKVSSNELISSINMSPEGIKISASRIDLEGYVTADELEAEVLKVLQYATVDTLVAGSIVATDGSFSSIGANNVTVNGTFTVAGNNASWAEQKVVTGLNGLNVTTATIPYVDHSGSHKYFSVVTAVAQNAPSTETISYLGT